MVYYNKNNIQYYLKFHHIFSILLFKYLIIILSKKTPKNGMIRFINFIKNIKYLNRNKMLKWNKKKYPLFLELSKKNLELNK